MSLLVSSFEPLLPRLSLRMHVVVCTSIALNLTPRRRIPHLRKFIRKGSLRLDLHPHRAHFLVASIALFFHLIAFMTETARNGWRAYRAKRRLAAASVAAIAGAWLVSALWLVPVGVHGFALVSGRGFLDGEPPVWMAGVVALMQVAALAAMVCTATFATHERRYGARAIYLP
ncbi:hypothetical protein HDZ31DRAFT_80416 [Schizophyllum fasciatum]